MERQEFWKLIDAARRDADGDGEGTGEGVQDRLAAMSPQAIRQFASHLNECMSRSYTLTLQEAFALMTGSEEHVSSDLFEYFRAWLVTRGEAVFEAVLRDADELASIDVEDPLEECSSESLLMAPEEAFEIATGEDDADLVELDCSRGVPAGRWTGSAPEVFPRLFAKYGEMYEV